MKKGFTLIEVTAVVLILAVLAIFIVPKVGSIISNNKDKACASIKKSAEDAAKNYTYLHIEEVDLGITQLGYYNVSVGKLQNEGLLKKNIENPYDGSIIPSTNNVKIEKDKDNENVYIYTYMGGECE